MCCCVQLYSSEGPCFLLHVMPVNPDSSHQSSKKNHNRMRMMSRAGEGPGLQVFPGSVAQVAQVRPVSRSSTGTYMQQHANMTRLL